MSLEDVTGMNRSHEEAELSLMADNILSDRRDLSSVDTFLDTVKAHLKFDRSKLNFLIELVQNCLDQMNKKIKTKDDEEGQALNREAKILRLETLLKELNETSQDAKKTR